MTVCDKCKSTDAQTLRVLLIIDTDHAFNGADRRVLLDLCRPCLDILRAFARTDDEKPL